MEFGSMSCWLPIRADRLQHLYFFRKLACLPACLHSGVLAPWEAGSCTRSPLAHKGPLVLKCTFLRLASHAGVQVIAHGLGDSNWGLKVLTSSCPLSRADRAN